MRVDFQYHVITKAKRFCSGILLLSYTCQEGLEGAELTFVAGWMGPPFRNLSRYFLSVLE